MNDLTWKHAELLEYRAPQDAVVCNVTSDQPQVVLCGHVQQLSSTVSGLIKSENARPASGTINQLKFRRNEKIGIQLPNKKMDRKETVTSMHLGFQLQTSNLDWTILYNAIIIY
jgi:hypothetical protein